MACFAGSGIIASDVVRRETQKGVVATFRLQTTTYRNRRLWITVETWGHLAGTINRHAKPGRPVLVNGRLRQKTWRDRKTGDARTNLVVAASDADLLPEGTCSMERNTPHSVQASGKVSGKPELGHTDRSATFTLSTGKTGSKAGLLWLPVQLRANSALVVWLSSGQSLEISGRLVHVAPQMALLAWVGVAPNPIHPDLTIAVDHAAT